jgi:hypothetical protein
MGNSHSIQKINFEDMQWTFKNPETCLLINTLPSTEQGCLIVTTIAAQEEEEMSVAHTYRSYIGEEEEETL